MYYLPDGSQVLLRQGKIDANSHSYLRKFCSSMSEKDAK